MTYFSFETSGFYREDMKGDYEHYNSWPKDAVEVTDDEEANIREAISSGKVVVADSNSKFSVKDSPAIIPEPLTLVQAQQCRLNAYRAESDHLKLEAEFNSISNGEPADYSAWIGKVEEVKARYPLPE